MPSLLSAPGTPIHRGELAISATFREAAVVLVRSPRVVGQDAPARVRGEAARKQERTAHEKTVKGFAK